MSQENFENEPTSEIAEQRLGEAASNIFAEVARGTKTAEQAREVLYAETEELLKRIVS